MPARPRARRGLGLGPTGPHLVVMVWVVMLPFLIALVFPQYLDQDVAGQDVESTTIFLHILCRVGLLGCAILTTYMHAVNKRGIPS